MLMKKMDAFDRLAAETDDLIEKASYSALGHAYNRAYELVETFNDTEECETQDCIFCEGTGQYEGQYDVLTCFKCDGGKKIV